MRAIFLYLLVGVAAGIEMSILTRGIAWVILVCIAAPTLAAVLPAAEVGMTFLGAMAGAVAWMITSAVAIDRQRRRGGARR